MKANQGKSMSVFFIVWVGQVFSSIGTAVARFAIIWWIASLTGSATALAVASLMTQIPRVALSPLAGALVDRWDRKQVLIYSDGLVALASLILAALFWLGIVRVWQVYVLMLVRAMIATFYNPAMLVVTGLMVPDKHLTRVAGMNQTLEGVISVAGPLLGALVLAILPLQSIMLIDVGTAAIAIFPLLFVRVVGARSLVQEKKRTSVAADLREGVRYIWAWPGMLLLLIGAALANFVLNPAFSLSPLLITKHFGGGALELSYLESGFGFGAIAGGLALSAWGGFKKKIVTMLTGVSIAAIGLFSIGVAPSSALLMAVAGVFIVGLSIALIDGPIFALMQSVVAPEMQGRVSTLIQAVSGAASPLGLAIAGPVADHIGVQAIYVIGALVFAAIAVGFRSIGHVMRIEERGAALRAEAEAANEPAPETEAVLVEA
jgi:DHA3 family macrolide efflux protein-like MFS transporter